MNIKILRLLGCAVVFLFETNLHAGLSGLSGKRDVYHGVVERIDGMRSITIKVSPDGASETLPICKYTELKKNHDSVHWDSLHIGSKVTLIVLTATEATEATSLFVDGKLTVEIQIEDSAGSGKRKSRSTKNKN